MAEIGHSLRIKYGLRVDPSDAHSAVGNRSRTPFAKRASSRGCRSRGRSPNLHRLQHACLCVRGRHTRGTPGRSSPQVVTLPEILKVLSHPAVMFMLGGVAGFLTSRFTMTKAERRGVQQTVYENSVRHQQQREERYKAFCDALRSYAQREDRAALNDFQAISTAGDLYFNELRIVADAILGNNIDRLTRQNTFIPAILKRP